jgi:CBS domain-containing protein
MEAHNFSQLPVVAGREVLGLFSYRSFSKAVRDHGRSATNSRRFDAMELTVADCMEKVPFARVQDEFVEWFDAIDRVGAVLVGDSDRLKGIVTAMDILRYLFEVSRPFVLISEIELGLRALIRLAVDSETLASFARSCLADRHKGEPPTHLKDMTFNEYVQIVGDGRYWEHFKTVFGGDRNRTRTRLEQLRKLRNDVFHFRRELTLEDHQTLVSGRDWILMRVRATEPLREERQR